MAEHTGQKPNANTKGFCNLVGQSVSLYAAIYGQVGQSDWNVLSSK